MRDEAVIDPALSKDRFIGLSMDFDRLRQHRLSADDQQSWRMPEIVVRLAAARII